MKKLCSKTNELKDFQINKGETGGSSLPIRKLQRMQELPMMNLNVMTINLSTGGELKLYQSPAGIGATLRDLAVVLDVGFQNQDYLLYAVDCTTRQRWGLNPRQVKQLVDEGHMSPNQLKSAPIIISLQAIEGLKNFKRYKDNILLDEIALKIREAI